MDFSALPKIDTTNPSNFFLIAGPCAIEGEEMAFEIAEKINGIAQKLEIPYIFKGSFKKANRSRIDSFSAISKAISSPSMAQGPAIKKKLLGFVVSIFGKAEKSMNIFSQNYLFF